MKKLGFGLGIAALLFLLSYTAAAQEPPLSPSTAKTRRPGPAARQLEIIEWELTLSRNAHSLKPDQRSLSRLAFALERLIPVVCMPHVLRTFDYRPDPGNDKCAQLSEELLRLDPENPVGLCARDGLHAKSCIEAYQQQVVTVVDPTAFGPRSRVKLDNEVALAFKLNFEKNREKLTELQKQRTALLVRAMTPTPAGPGSQADEQREMEQALFRELMRASCGVIRVFYEEESALKSTYSRYAPTPTVSASEMLRAETQKMLEEVQRLRDEQAARKETPKAAPTASGPVFKRVRYISKLCEDSVTQARQKFPELAAPVCYRIGLYSPQCLAAKSREPAMKSPSSGRLILDGGEEF